MRCRVFCSILCLVLILSVGVVLVPALLTCAAEDPTSPTRGTDPSANPNVPPAGDLPVPTTGKVIKSEKEWLKQLTRPQFMVTRMKATEPAFSGKYVNNHAIGTYACVCCGAPLFNSRAKFESGTGWPSFWTPYCPRTDPDGARLPRRRAAGRGDVQQVRRPPGPRLQRWPAADRSPLLHQLGLPEVPPGGEGEDQGQGQDGPQDGRGAGGRTGVGPGDFLAPRGGDPAPSSPPAPDSAPSSKPAP